MLDLFKVSCGYRHSCPIQLQFNLLTTFLLKLRPYAIWRLLFTPSRLVLLRPSELVEAHKSVSSNQAHSSVPKEAEAEFAKLERECIANAVQEQLNRGIRPIYGRGIWPCPLLRRPL